jgi:hypothetical protein
MPWSQYTLARSKASAPQPLLPKSAQRNQHNRKHTNPVSGTGSWRTTNQPKSRLLVLLQALLPDLALLAQEELRSTLVDCFQHLLLPADEHPACTTLPAASKCAAAGTGAAAVAHQRPCSVATFTVL